MDFARNVSARVCQRQGVQRLTEGDDVSTQLELCLYQPGTIAEAIFWSLHNTCDHIANGTMDDYQERARWLLRVLTKVDGCEACDKQACPKHTNCDLKSVNYERLLMLSKKYGPKGGAKFPLMMTTVKRRFVFLYKVMNEAFGRELIDKMPVFPKLRGDGRARKRIHDYKQFQAMRAQLAEPWRTWVTVGWFTGMHPYDLNRMRESWFRLDEPYKDAGGHAIAPGQWLRHNHKTDQRDEDLVWLPMENDFHAWMSARVQRGAPTDRVCGRYWKPSLKLSVACERADVPRISPIDLRRSRATIWCAAGKSDEWIRVALGHRGHGWTGPEVTAGQGERKPARPSTRTTHYYRPSVDLIAGDG